MSSKFPQLDLTLYMYLGLSIAGDVLCRADRKEQLNARLALLPLLQAELDRKQVSIFVCMFV